MKKTMNEYAENKTLIKTTWDNMQQNVRNVIIYIIFLFQTEWFVIYGFVTQLHCCGTNNFTDWSATSFSGGKDVPDSCCFELIKDCGKGALVDHTDGIYHGGCADALKKSALGNLGTLVGAAVGLAVVQVSFQDIYY